MLIFIEVGIEEKRMAQNTDNTELPKILRNYSMIRDGFMGSSSWDDVILIDHVSTELIC